MIPVYSSVLFSGSIAGPAATDLFTVESGFVYIMRELTVYNDSGSILSLAVQESGGIVLAMNPAIAIATPWDWQGHHAIAEGEVIHASINQVSARVRVSGYRLVAT